MVPITHRYIMSKLEKELIIWINPENIKSYVGKNVPFIKSTNYILKNYNKSRLFTQRIITNLTPFFIPVKHYDTAIPIEEHGKFKKIEDLIEKKDNYHNSFWYEELLNQLELHGLVKHKGIILNSKSELDDFFESYVLVLVESMEKNGYDCDKAKEFGYITIGKNGEIDKSNAGDHRLMVAKILGLNLMPFKVKGVHEEWARSKEIPNNKKGIPYLVEALKEVEINNQ